jgi:CheY-like chemotaxis protein
MVCRILVADDSSTIQKVIRIGLSSIPNDIRSVGSMTEAMRAVESTPVDLIIVGAGLPGVSTANDFIKLLEHAGRVPIIVLIGSYDVVREADLRSAGIQHIMKKPFPPGDLTRIVAELTPQLKAQTPSHESSVKLPTGQNFTGPNWNMPPPGGILNDPAMISQSMPQPIPDASPYGAISSFDLGERLPPATIPPQPQIEPDRKGRPAFDLNSQELPVTPSPTSHLREQPAKVVDRSPPLADQQGSSSRVTGMSAAVEAFVLNELPPLVDRAVERYCIEHFKHVAREALTAELRRLAEEKARFLVDQ